MRTIAVVSMLVISCGAAPSAFAGGGLLDTSFGVNGRKTIDLGGAFDGINSMEIDSQGRIAIAGTGATNWAAYGRLLPNGDPDDSFIIDGTHTVTGAIHGVMTLLADDQMLFAAGRTAAPRKFSVSRIQTNGLTDTSFGVGGLATFPGPSQVSTRCVAVQPDGKILVGGYDIWDSSNWDWIIGRFLPTGVLDPNFGGGAGWVRIDFSRPEISNPIDFLLCLEVLPNGRIVAGGLTATTAAMSTGNRIYAMAGLLPNGELDPNFAGGGKHVFSYVTEGFQQENIADLLRLPNGKLLAASGGGSSTALIRFLPNGEIDTTFGVDGRIEAPTTQTVWRNLGDLYLDEFGGVLARGGGFSVTRFRADGTIDPYFGVNGTANTTFNQPQQGGGALAVTPEGRILVGGYSGVANVDYDWSLAAYTPVDDCPGDITGDDLVDLFDLGALLANFGATNAAPVDGDADHDGDVDLEDVALLLSRFGEDCE